MSNTALWTSLNIFYSPWMVDKKQNKSYCVQLNYNLTKRTQHIDISNDDYKIASVAICYNFIRRDLSWNWISNLVVRLAIWTLGNWKPKNSWLMDLHFSYWANSICLSTRSHGRPETYHNQQSSVLQSSGIVSAHTSLSFTLWVLNISDPITPP